MSNEELHALDFIARDLRRASTVTIVGRALTLTLPDYYSAYDARGTRLGLPVTPTIAYGVAARQARSVSYAVVGKELIHYADHQRSGCGEHHRGLLECERLPAHLRPVEHHGRHTIATRDAQTVSGALNAGTTLSYGLGPCHPIPC